MGMGSSVLKGGILGGLVLFLWSILSWKILPWHAMSVHQFKDEKYVYEVIKRNASESGIYVLPNMYTQDTGSGDQSKQWAAQQRMVSQGPVMFASISVEGIELLNWTPFIIAFLMQAIAAGVVTALVLQMRSANYKKRVGFAVTIGFLASLLSIIPAWNWWEFTDLYTIVSMTDALIGWALAGCVIASLVIRSEGKPNFPKRRR